MAPGPAPALLPNDSILAGSTAGSPLRTVLSPAAPARGTGDRSPEVSYPESLAEVRVVTGLRSNACDTSPPVTGSAFETAHPASLDKPRLLTKDSDAVTASPSSVTVDHSGTSGTTPRDDGTGDTDRVGGTPPVRSDLAAFPVRALPAMEHPHEVTTVCGYKLRMRTAEQLAAMRPVKRARRSIITEETGEVDCIDNRRAVATRVEYRVTWTDDSDPIWLPRDRLIEDGNANLIETLDAYLLRFPNRELPYQAYISRNARAFSAVADGGDNACLPHAVQMALELLGHQQESARLPEIWTEYLQSAIEAKVPLHEGFHRLSQIVRYCTKAVPRCGVEPNIKTLRKNLYNGDGAGAMAIVRRVLPDASGVRVLSPGVYLVGGYKRNMRAHCFAMEVTADEDIIVRENGINSGIGDLTWLRMIKFIRKFEVQPHNK